MGRCWGAELGWSSADRFGIMVVDQERIEEASGVMESITTPEAIDAIRRIAVVAGPDLEPPRLDPRPAIRRVAARASEMRARRWSRAREIVASAQLTPGDSLHCRWDVFRMLGVSRREVWWTQWLASALDPTYGAESARIIWEALCDAILEQPAHGGIDERLRGRLANPRHWETARRIGLGPGQVESEVSVVLGEGEQAQTKRPDILVVTDDFYVVLELKVDAGWSGEDQPELYRQLALQEAGPARRIGLLVLAAEERHAPGYHSLTWRRLAQHVRRRLVATPIAQVSHAVPVWALLRAIETHMLGLDGALERVVNGGTWSDLAQVEELCAYLEWEGS